MIATRWFEPEKQLICLTVTKLFFEERWGSMGKKRTREQKREADEANYQRRKERDLRIQVVESLRQKISFGESRKDFQDCFGELKEHKIFSFDTYRTYKKQGEHFAKWVKENYPEITKLENTKHLIPEYLDSYPNDSVYTIKTKLSALACILDERTHITLEKSKNGNLYIKRAAPFGVETPKRERANIKRSRKENTVGDKHFSEKSNADLITFHKCVGTRGRSESLMILKGDFKEDENGNLLVDVTRNTKNGRPRHNVPVVGSDKEIALVKKMISGDSNEKVFEKIHSNADIHSYRAVYAARLYLKHARPIEELSNKQIYFPRKDRAGERYDREAMLIVSKALGHNRISVVAQHYFWKIPEVISELD